jgi:hypothetical protein
VVAPYRVCNRGCKRAFNPRIVRLVGTTREWVLLAYRIPREPSTPRISVWRKLRRLGAVQILDGLVGLPSDARTKERLEWIAEEVIEAGGEASIWLSHPASKAHERVLVAQIEEDADAAYDAIVEAAKVSLSESPGRRRRTLSRLRRELQAARQRDYFPKRGLERARSAVDRLADSLDETARVTR